MSCVVLASRCCCLGLIDLDTSCTLSLINRLSCNNVAVFGKAPCAFRLLQAGSYSGLIALRKISVKPMHLIDVAQAPWK